MWDFRKQLKTPKFQLALILLAIFATAFIFHQTLKILLSFSIAVVSTVVADFLFLKIRKVQLFFPSAAIVSGTIIGLLAGPNLFWYEIVLIGIVAMFAKQFIRIRGKVIFNPAAFGLLIVGLMFTHNVSWWGVSWQQFQISNFPTSLFELLGASKFLIFNLILFLPLWISGFKLKRYLIILFFLITYLILTRRFIFDPTVLFFSFVMLPEPQTTPFKPKQQIIFGITVALFTIIFSLPIFSFIPDALILALLIGNVIYFTYTNYLSNPPSQNASLFALRATRDKSADKGR